MIQSADTTRIFKARLQHIAIMTFIAIVTVAGSALAVTVTLPQDGRDLALANSDALLAEGLYRDLFQDRYPLADWRFSTTTFLFPDAPLYFLARLFAANVGEALWIFAASLFALTVLASGLAVAWQSGGEQPGADANRKRRVRAALALAGLGGTAFALANHWGWIGAGVWLPDPYMATWHGGTCLAAFASVALFQRWLASRAHWIAILLSLNGIFATASDAAFFTMFTAPALGAWLLTARRADRKTWFSGAALLFGPALAGRLLLRSLSASGAIRIADPAARAVDQLSAIASRQTLVDIAEVLTALSPAFWIASVGSLALLWLLSRARRHSDHASPAPAWLHAWLALSILSQPIITALAGRLLYDFPWQPRYLLTALYIPFLFALPMTLAPILAALPRRSYVAALVGILALLATPSLHLAQTPLLRPATPPLVNCVDQYAREYSLRSGLAGYFEAKPLAFYSQTGLRVNQIGPDFAPFYWLNNFAWYLGRTDAAIEYDFLVWPQSGAARAIARYGQPDRTVTCPGAMYLLIYTTPHQTRFRRQYSREGLLLWRRAVGLE